MISCSLKCCFYIEIRYKCISYSTFKKKENTKQEAEIVSHIKHMEVTLSESIVHILEQKWMELKEIRARTLDSLIIRSRTKWLFEVKKNTRYFCNLEKRNYVQKSMSFIQKDDGNIIHDSDSVTKEAKHFYDNEYFYGKMTLFLSAFLHMRDSVRM